MATGTKSERLEASVTGSQLDLIERAAAFEGKSLDDFVVSTLQEAARKIVCEHETMMLGERDRKVFYEALLNPTEPNEAFRRAVETHRRLTGQG